MRAFVTACAYLVLAASGLDDICDGDSCRGTVLLQSNLHLEGNSKEETDSSFESAATLPISHAVQKERLTLVVAPDASIEPEMEGSQLQEGSQQNGIEAFRRSSAISSVPAAEAEDEEEEEEEEVEATAVALGELDAQDLIPWPGVKKGLSLYPTGAFQCKDVATFNLDKLGWWYSWRQNVTPAWSSPEQCGAEQKILGPSNFVPMLKNQLFLEPNPDWPFGIDQTYERSPFLMGFNEPYTGHTKKNTGVEKMSVDFAIEKMKAVIAKAESFDIPKEIVAPSVNPKKKAMEWYRIFRDKAVAAGIWSKFKYMSLHYYKCDVKVLKKGINKVYKEFKLPIWVTEFACAWDATGTVKLKTTEAQSLAFMKKAIPMLEAHPHVVRYAWFSGRSNAAETSLMTQDTSNPALTPLGQWYNDYAYPGRESRQPPTLKP